MGVNLLYYLVILINEENYFYYACPENMLTVEDIPEYAGLIYVSEKEFNNIRR